jgi:type II secretory pathway component PulK
MQLPGMTRELYLKLKPHIAALPPSARTINVCMAGGVVLDALFALDPDAPAHVEYSLLSKEQLDEQRADDCFPRRTVLSAGVPAMQSMTTERSSWFQLRTWIRVGTAQFDLYSLINRSGRQARAVTRTLGTE